MVWIADSYSAVVWVIVTFLTGLAAWRAAARLCPGDCAWQRLGGMLVIAESVITLTAISFGSMKILNRVTLLTTVGGLAIAWLAINARANRQIATSPNNFPEVSETNGPEPRSRSQRQFWLTIWSIVFLLWLAHVVGALLRFPDDGDTIIYHLPLVNHWLQTGNLYIPDCLQWYTPANNELVALWMVAPFTGDFLVTLNNLPATVLLAWGALEIGRQLTVTELWRNVSAMAVISSAVVFRQLESAGNDVAVAGLFLASLAYAFRYATNNSQGDLILGVLCLGLLVGVKYYSLGYAAVVVVAVCPLLLCRVGWRRSSFVVGAGTMSVLLLGGYWYIRNWVFGGTCLYPLGYLQSTDELSRGYPGIWRSTFLGNGDPALFSLTINALWTLTGICHVLAVLCLPITIVWITLSSYSARLTAGQGLLRATLVVATVSTLIVLLVTPFAVEDQPATLNSLKRKYAPIRYGSCLLSLAILCLAIVLDDVSRYLSNCCTCRLFKIVGRTIPLVAALAVATQFTIQFERTRTTLDDVLLVGDVALLFSCGYLLYTQIVSPKRHIISCAGALIGSVGVMSGVGYLSHTWHRDYVGHYDQNRGHLLELLTRESHSGTTICLLHYPIYPFFGSERQFHVCQPSRVQSSPAWWRQYLRTRQVQYVVVYKNLHQDRNGWNHLQALCDAAPQMFECVKEDSRFVVYRVKKEP